MSLIKTINGANEQEKAKLIYLCRNDIIQADGDHSSIYVEAITNVLEHHAKGEFVQPLKPYLRVEDGVNHIADRIIAMPSYIGGEFNVSGMKWIGSKHDNPERGLERASGLIILNDPETNYPIAVLEAGWISGMRTAAVTAVAAKYLAKGHFETISCMGCGWIAKLQIKTMLEQFKDIAAVHLYDIHQEQMYRLRDELKVQFPAVQFNAETSAEHAVRQGEVVITCTVTDRPYIPYEWLQAGVFLCNVSIMDVHKEVFLYADKVVVDDWEQSNREKKVINQLVQDGKFSRKQLYAELGEIVIGAKKGRENDEEKIILNPMGMAIEDIACAYELYKKATHQQKGSSLHLYHSEQDSK
jgi:2,3-diaminopropionate biosynthesis protein SbnB